MDKATAGEIGANDKMYVGQHVEFLTQGFPTSGTLDQAFTTGNGPYSHLVVDGTSHVVNDYEIVTVS